MIAAKNVQDVNFLEGTLLLVNKPKNWTSFDVVNKIRGTLRYQLDVKKIKVGHAGTLDPMATGLLLICTGKWTKKIESLQGMDKAYEGEMTFGGSTDTYDAESEISETAETSHLNQEVLKGGMEKFIGPIQQIPPIYSAIKMKGKPAYVRARKGEDIVMKARPVTIHSFDIMDWKSPQLKFSSNVSKGTYIRSLAHDLGIEVGSRAYLSALTRTSVGTYLLEDAWELNELVDAIEKAFARPLPLKEE